MSVELTEREIAVAELVAARVLEALHDRPAPPPRIAHVPELAQILGLSPDAVRDHADELGASRVGTRLVFDVAEALRRTRAPVALPAPPPVAGPRARRRPASSTTVLLPIKGRS